MYSKKVLTILIMVFHFTTIINAQFHMPVLSDLSGQVLLDALEDQYRPTNVLSFSNARDTMFSKIDAKNDSLIGVYSGHTIFLDPNEDPTQAAYMDGSNDGINTEHTYPQAFGASSGNAKSDMHHLFPTRTPVNAARANFPFAEIPDNETQTWFYLNQSQSSIPNQNIDAYSEFSNGLFEPREDHKGNVARAMFYFYTIYNMEAVAADPNYFENQKATLCEWHYQDPVDAKEWERNNKIASYQDDKPNPFILDCTLAERSYCENMMLSCQFTAINKPTNKTYFSLFQNSPNPFKKRTTIRFTIHEAANYQLSVFNLLGQEVEVLTNQWYAPGTYEIDWEIGASRKTTLLFYNLKATAHPQIMAVKKMLFIKD